MDKDIKKYFPVFVLPTLISFVIVFFIPFLQGVFLSFTDFQTVNNYKYVGLSNYIKAFSNKDFINALWFTCKFTIVSVVTVNFFAFVIALLLTRKIKGQNIFRTMFFMPNLIGGIVLGYIWLLILNGLLLPYNKTILSSATFGFWGLVILTNWQLIGYMMVIYIAGIQNIPGELIEAAEMDGAKPFEILKNVTIPLVMPSITICLFLTFSNSFKMFDQNLALTAGEPKKSTTMLALDIFKTFYDKPGSEGVGQAKAVLFFILVAVLAITQLVISRRKEIEN